MHIYIHGTISSSHENDVEQSVKDGWTDSGGLLANLTTTQVSGLVSDAMEQARLNGVSFVVRSYTGITSHHNTAEKYHNVVGLCMPPGSNSPGQIYGYTIPQAVIVNASGDDGINETADNCEFIGQDPITPEVADPDELDLSSFGNPYCAGQLAYIMDQCSCSIWEARARAQATGSEGGTWDEVNGYGSIDTAAAIAYSGTLASNPFPLNPVGDIVAERISGGNVNLTLDWINGATRYIIYRNGTFLKYTESLTETDTLPTNGVFSYTYKGENELESTETSISASSKVGYAKSKYIIAS